MNEILGSNIVRLRKERGMTQEQLANALGISYQAVSKWETANSCPDISTLPLLADLFQVSLDELFGRRTGREECPEAEKGDARPGDSLPWPDDDCFYMVLYHGHERIGASEGALPEEKELKRFLFQYEGQAKDIVSSISVQVDGDVFGSVSAGESVSCGDVSGSVQAGGGVECSDVAGSVEANGGVECSDVDGNVSAGGSVKCGDVGGNVSAGGNVNCSDVARGVIAGGNVSADEIGGSFNPGDKTEPAMENLSESLSFLGDELSRRLSGLGELISQRVEKAMGKQGYLRKRSFGEHGGGESHIEPEDQEEE